MRWRPSKVIEREARALQRRLGRAIRSAAPRAKHRGVANRQTGGLLSRAVQDAGLLTVKRWGVVLRFSELGQTLLWFTKGTSRQRARPLELTPDTDTLAKAVSDDAAKHFERRAAREASK